MHITISGNLGSGKSTVGAVLKDKYNFSVYSTGVIQRGLAEKMNLTTLEMNHLMSSDVKYDHLIDDEVARISREEKENPIVFDSRMAWLFAQNSFKVYLIISPVMAARRVIDTRKSSVESYESIDDAVSKLKERAEAENERFKKIYQVDNLDYRNYNLLVDTTYLAPEQIADIIYDGYKKWLESPHNDTTVVISPKSLYPLCEESQEEASEEVEMTFLEGYNYVVSGQDTVLCAVKENKSYINATVVDASDSLAKRESLVKRIKDAGMDAVRKFEKEGNFKYCGYPEYYA